MEKHDLSVIDFKLIDEAFTALLQSIPNRLLRTKSKACAKCFMTPTPAGSKFMMKPHRCRTAPRTRRVAANIAKRRNYCVRHLAIMRNSAAR